MTKTKYYDLQMDDSQDNYDVEVVNANLKKIDEQMKTRENATDALQEPEFTVADKRENIASKEKISKILGKIAKFFTDLKKVAFTGDYADLTNKPTYGKGFITDKSGSITINLDGETITLDQAKNVIKLADTLKDKIGDAFPSANVANNQTTTKEGFALDARQANPNIDGSLAKQISDLNGSLNKLNTMVSISDCDSIDSIVEIMIKNKDKIGEGKVGNQQQTALKGVIGNIPGGHNYVDVFARYYSDVFFILFGCDRYAQNIAINFIHYIGPSNKVASGWITIIKDS